MWLLDDAHPAPIVFLLLAALLFHVRLAAQPTPTESPSSAPRNLGPAINTDWDDFLPLISADGRTLYFTRAVPPKRDDMEWDFDIYFSTRQADGAWSAARSIGEPLNPWDLNDLLSMSPDGNRALLGRRYLDNGGETENGFSIARRSSTGWSRPVDVEIEDYTNNSSMRSASLCGDGATLLLAISGDDTRGNLDLYVSFMNDEGAFSEPMNLGDDLNTTELEVSPFLAPDGVTLYFSSAGHGGYGDNDIFVSRRLDSTWRRWSTPVNLGPRVNGMGYDANYTVSAVGDFAYMVSYTNTTGGKDIFEIALSSDAAPRPTILISGHVLDAKSGRPVDAVIRYELLPEGRDRGRGLASAESGYAIALPTEGVYGLRAEAPGSYAVNDTLDLSASRGYRQERRDLWLWPIEVGATINLNNVFFETGRAEITAASFPELNRVVDLLKRNGDLRIEIAGHTDNAGNGEENRDLSRRRARAVLDYLVAGGIGQERLLSEGYGSTKPATANSTAEGRRMNRRVELRIIAN